MAKKGIFVFAATLLLVMCVSLTAHAAVYLGTGDNVDSGGHLDWDYDTTYYSQTVWGMNLWNGYKSGVIREDSPLVVQDIFVTDVNSATAGYYGY